VKLLVTGGTGFVGPAVVRALVRHGHDVRLLARKPQDADVRELVAEGAEAVQGDMTDAESLQSAVEGQEGVVHLVAVRQGPRDLFERVMEQGTRDLVAAAKEAGVRRFVLMSALGLNEQTKDVVPYYHAKWEQEQEVQRSGIDHVIFRPSFVFSRDGGILPTFAKLAKLAPVTPITGKGTQRIQPVWIDDVAEFFARAVDEPAATGRTFDLGGPDAVTWNEFWERLKRTLGVRRRPSVHMPMWFMRANALVTERLPGNIPLTRDLLKMLEAGDNTGDVQPAVETFGVEPMPLDEQLQRGTGREAPAA
jgi:NADH dehydrogenase